MAVAERLRIAVEQALIDTAVGQFKATISLGVASLGDENPTLQALLAAGDRALYAAKQAGRNCVRGATAGPKDVALSVREEGTRSNSTGAGPRRR